MGKWCDVRKKYISDFDLIGEELDKETPDLKEIRSLLFRIETDYQELEEENSEQEDEIYELKREVSHLEEEVEWFNRRDSQSEKPSMLDSHFKRSIFEKLDRKYTWWQLEEKLKDFI